MSRVETTRGIDPTYATGDPDTFNSFGFYGAYPVTSKLLFDSRIDGTYNDHRDLESAIVNLRSGFKRPFLISDRLTIAPSVGINWNYTYLQAQSPASESKSNGLYGGIEASYRLLPSHLYLVAGALKSTNENNMESRFGIGFLSSKTYRLQIMYKDQKWKRSVEASIGFIF